MGLKEAFRRLPQHRYTSAKQENLSPDDSKSRSIPDDSEPPELRHAASLEMLMCRYINRILKTEMVVLADTKYVAISHVWGDALWQPVDGVEGEIMISDEKAKFLKERMRELVGEGFFWMDILCINQRDKAARVAVTQYIPATFRRAQQTIAIRGGEGIRYCCYQAAKFPSDTAELLEKMMFPPCLDRLTRHYEEHHVGEDCAIDGMISRLWPLQELLVSDTIHFVQCQFIPRIRSMGDFYQPRHGEYYGLLAMSLIQIAFMGQSWESQGSTKEASKNVALGAGAVFVDAYLRCGSAARSPIIRTLVRPHLQAFQISARRTTKSQDFILAFMPQYDFYTVPTNAKDLSFGELFVDCVSQMRNAPNTNFDADPFFMGVIPSLRPENIPEPLFLGDFVKLFDTGSGAVPWPLKQFRDIIKVKVEDANDLQRVIKVVERSRPSSLLLWRHTGTLERSQVWREAAFGVQVPFSFPENEAAVLKSYLAAFSSALVSLRTRLYSNSEFKALLARNGREYHPALIRLLAIISSGLGVNAYGWSRNKLRPVIVTVEGNEILGLVPNTVFEESSRPMFFIVEDKLALLLGRRWRKCNLIAATNGDGSRTFTKCIFPKCINYYGWERWKNWNWYRKNKYG
jgi:hypothetical protein